MLTHTLVIFQLDCYKEFYKRLTMKTNQKFQLVHNRKITGTVKKP